MSILEPLKREYIATGKVRFTWRHLAFLGQESMWAAEASECANEQGRFWEYHDYLFANQAGENQGAFALDRLKQFARELGLDTGAFNSCLDSHKYESKVEMDINEARQKGATGTPAFFVGDTLIPGLRPWSGMKAVIEEELAKLQ